MFVELNVFYYKKNFIQITTISSIIVIVIRLISLTQKYISTFVFFDPN